MKPNTKNRSCEDSLQKICQKKGKKRVLSIFKGCFKKLKNTLSKISCGTFFKILLEFFEKNFFFDFGQKNRSCEDSLQKFRQKRVKKG